MKWANHIYNDAPSAGWKTGHQLYPAEDALGVAMMLMRRKKMKMTKEIVDIIYEASNRFDVKNVIEIIEKELNIKVEK